MSFLFQDHHKRKRGIGGSTLLKYTLLHLETERAARCRVCNACMYVCVCVCDEGCIH